MANCKDGAVCYHYCKEGQCFRKRIGCLPLEGSGLDDNWEEVEDLTIADSTGKYYPENEIS